MPNLYPPLKHSYTVSPIDQGVPRFRQMIENLGLTLASSHRNATVMIVTNMSLPFISGRIARRFDIPHIVHSLWLENSAQAGRVLPWGRYEILFTDEDENEDLGTSSSEDEAPVARRDPAIGEAPEDTDDEENGEDNSDEDEVIHLSQYDMPLPPQGVRLVKLGRGFSIRHTEAARAYTERWTFWFYSHMPEATLFLLSKTYVRILNKAFHVRPGMSPTSMKWYFEQLWSNSEKYRKRVTRLTRAAGSTALMRSAFEQVDRFLAAP